MTRWDNDRIELKVGDWIAWAGNHQSVKVGKVEKIGAVLWVSRYYPISKRFEHKTQVRSDNFMKIEPYAGT